jgi:4-diphosphocytidyl-2-C-methyl-D-erythritol kinase
MRWLAPAKINLHLRVGKRRNDGFHPLCSWLVTVGLFDRLIVKRDPSGFSFSCDDVTIPSDDRNLVVKAARSFANATVMAPEQLGCSVTLLKSIPHGSGLGGGSSDAATVLVALNQLFGSGWTEGQLIDVGATIGSDVPFFFRGPSAVLTGRGESVKPLAPPAVNWAVLVLPPMQVSTAECYRQFDSMGLGNDGVLAEPDFAQWATLNAADLSGKLVNDLEPPAFALQPNLGALRDRIEADTKHVVRMSGSGSSLFVLADEPTEAAEIAATVTRNCGIHATAVQLAPDPRVQNTELAVNE